MKQDKIDLKRKLILHAALKIFGIKGYHYATISEIASEAGISRGLIHFYFENKLDLLVSLLLDFVEKVNTTHQQVLAKAKDPVEKLHLYFNVFNDIILYDEDSLYWGNVLREGIPQDQVMKSEVLSSKSKRISEENKKLLTTIVSIIKQAQAGGSLDKSISPQVLALIFGGSSQLLYYGLFLQRTRSIIVNDQESINESNIKKAMETLLNKFSIKF
jgi:AcrR family transcriptional regulator